MGVSECRDVGNDVGKDLEVGKEWGKVVKVERVGMYLLQGGRRDEVSDEITSWRTSYKFAGLIYRGEQ